MQCECCDPGCTGHDAGEGFNNTRCTFVGDYVVLYRADMDDRHGTRMCDACADYARESGLF